MWSSQTSTAVCVCVCVCTCNAHTALALYCWVAILWQTSQCKAAPLWPASFCGESQGQALLGPLLGDLTDCRRDAVRSWLEKDHFQAHVAVVFNSCGLSDWGLSVLLLAASSAPGLTRFPTGPLVSSKAAKEGDHRGRDPQEAGVARLCLSPS